MYCLDTLVEPKIWLGCGRCPALGFSGCSSHVSEETNGSSGFLLPLTCRFLGNGSPSCAIHYPKCVLQLPQQTVTGSYTSLTFHSCRYLTQRFGIRLFSFRLLLLTNTELNPTSVFERGIYIASEALTAYSCLPIVFQSKNRKILYCTLGGLHNGYLFSHKIPLL